MKLSFSSGNAKLSKDIATFSLPCGWSCPFAKECKTRISREGKMVEGGHKIRCYASGTESMFSVVRKSRWGNFDLLRKARTVRAMSDLIHDSLPNKKLLRIHQSGDFYSQAYFDAWIDVARRNPSKIFYTYTKSLPYWITRKDKLPSNFRLVASYGGKSDGLIASNGLRYCKVVLSEDEARLENLPVSHDDKDHYEGSHSYAIQIHGTQPKGSVASKAWDHIMKHGKGGYKAVYFKKGK